MKQFSLFFPRLASSRRITIFPGHPVQLRTHGGIFSDGVKRYTPYAINNSVTRDTVP